MISFKEYLREKEELETLIESAGNLKGLPKEIIKAIVDTDSYMGNGGKNSELVLFKKDAKQSDLTAACKYVGGFVKPGEEGYRSKSKAELEAEARKSANAGVLVKINDVVAFYAGYDDYTKKFKLISDRGYIRKDGSIFDPKGSYRYTEGVLTATDLSKYINFKEDKVDIYLVTADVERELKRQERAEVRGAINDVRKITPERKKAIVEFLKKRSGGVINDLVSDIQTSTDNLNKIIESSINRAMNGEEKDYTGDFKKITDELYNKLGKINKLGYYIASMVKEGTIKGGYKKEDSYNYKTFKELVSAFEESGI